MPDLFAVDALGPRGAYHARDRHLIRDVTGEPAAELSLVPPLFVTRALTALHGATAMTVDERIAAITRGRRDVRHGNRRRPVRRRLRARGQPGRRHADLRGPRHH